VSLEDELVARHVGVARKLAAALARPDGSVPRTIARLVVRRAQRVAERLHARARRDLVRVDEQLETALAFSARRA
jgi:preprotein translocase subunit SecA